MNVKYLMTLAVILTLVLALAARQGTPGAKPDDSERNQSATGQPSSSPAADRTDTPYRTDTTEQKAQSEIKANDQSKLSLTLGSVPCPPDDKKCPVREKEKLSPPQQEHP